MGPPYSRTLFELLCEQAERFPERIAVICGERKASYRDLAEAAGRIGAALAGARHRPRRPGRHPDQQPAGMARSCFGAAALGRDRVPFSTWSKPAELAYLLADSEIEALFAVERVRRPGFRRALAVLVPEQLRAGNGVRATSAPAAS